MCVSKLYVGELSVKSCVSVELCVDKLCVCVSELCVCVCVTESCMPVSCVRCVCVWGGSKATGGGEGGGQK